MEEDFTSLLNSAVGGNIHWRRQPVRQDAYPYINLSLVSSPTDYTTTGESGLQEASIQVDAWAENYSEAVTLARSVQTALSGYSGIEGTTNFQGIWKEVEFDREAELQRADGKRYLHCRSVDYRIAYS